MTASLRVLAAAIAAAMVTISVAVSLANSRPREISLLWFFFGGVACAYVVMAIGHFATVRRKANFESYSLYAVIALSLSIIVAFGISLREEFTGEGGWQIVACVLVGIASVAATALLLRVVDRSVGTKVADRFAPVTLAIGALFVLSSLFFKIGLSKESTGWTVLIRQDHWVTHYASVGQSAFLGGRIPWLQPIFGPVGYAFYVLALATSLAVVVWVIGRRFRAADSADSDIFARLTTLVAMGTVWLLTDIFWGWHYDLSERPWLATIAALCWLASLVFAAALLVPVAHGKRDPWRFRALLLSQLPLLTFNAVMLPIYLGRDDYLPGFGLAFLMIGLQVQCWTCVYLVTARKKPEVKLLKPFAAAA